MLEDTKTALSDLDKVTVFFRQLEDECLVASKTPRPFKPCRERSGSCALRLNEAPLCRLHGGY